MADGSLVAKMALTVGKSVVTQATLVLAADDGTFVHRSMVDLSSPTNAAAAALPGAAATFEPLVTPWATSLAPARHHRF